MQSDPTQTTEDDTDAVLDRVRPLRAGLIEEIVRRQKDLAALRAKLAGVEMVIRECANAE